MAKSSKGAGAILLLACIGCSGGGSYLPLSVGNRWDYEVRYASSMSPEERQEVLGFTWEVHSRLGKGQALMDIVTLTRTEAGERADLTHGIFHWDRSGLWVEDLSRPEGTGRYLLVRLPVEEGSRWLAGGMRGQVEGEETVQTPVGDFDHAVRIRFVHSEKADCTLDVWLVRGIGMVRQESREGGKRLWAAELVSRRKGDE